ncbi:MAG TPA: FHA domain-containing protein [Anaerolineales bacterium]|nr:FHA domain-containing protein [Anaerolineales bacterium]
MKSITAFLLALIFMLAVVVTVSAQASESIWLTANTTAYKTGETVIATVNAASTTPIQGFTFQIRYDPKCLRPINAASPIPGMNGLPLPQLSGQVDGSYASTTPQIANGMLAQVRFTALGGCQTNLTLESAALAIRNESGFAAPLPGVTIGEKNIALNIDKALGTSQSPENISGAILPLDPPPAAAPKYSVWIIALVVVLVIGAMFGAFKLFRIGAVAANVPSSPKASAPSQMPTVQIKHGPNAGKSFRLNKLPCFIGRDPINEICLNDPHVIGQHVKIFTKDDGYYLMDLGGETFINGQAIRRSSTILKSGDVVRLGKSALFVFGS